MNVTPLEPGWQGHVTLEISNATPLPARVYANEGICQFVFLRGSTSRSAPMPSAAARTRDRAALPFHGSLGGAGRRSEGGGWGGSSGWRMPHHEPPRRPSGHRHDGSERVMTATKPGGSPPAVTGRKCSVGG